MNHPSPSESSPLVTAIVPAFNAAGFVGECLRSILAQTYPAVEVIVVDDGSTDNTAELVERVAAADPRVRLFRQTNAGVGAARNLGIRHAQGEFIAPIDADDLWHPKKIAAQVSVARAGGPSVGLVYCWNLIVDSGGGALGHGKAHLLEGSVAPALTLHNFIGNASVPLFRREALHTVGVYLTREEQGGGQGCEDWDLHVRVAERYQVGLARDFLVSYRQLPASMSVNGAAMARSFEVFLRRVRERNPAKPRRFLHWTSGHFYRYLFHRCFFRENYRQCIRYAFRAIRVDPIIGFNLATYRLMLVAFARLLLGPGLKRTRHLHPVRRTAGKVPWGQRWFSRAEAARWELVTRDATVAMNPPGESFQGT